MTVAADSPERSVQAELRKWNWGAFLLTWIWALGNRVWIGLLALVPIVGFVMMVVLGIKGNEWAWQKGGWGGVEHFRSTQRKWVVAGIVVWVAVLVGWVLLFAAGGSSGGSGGGLDY